jgi:NosR/NirI family nitrous oxide reductase transcriptional regulator
MNGPIRRPGHRRHRWLARAVHALRVALVVSLLLAIPSPTVKPEAEPGVAPKIEQLRLDDAFQSIDGFRVAPEQDAAGMWRVVNADDGVVAFAARTMPAAAEVVGYRGPTEAAILLDKDSLQLVSVALLNSADTEEHIEAVVNDEAFLRQFEGWPWGGPPGNIDIDAVSGATLTSLALAEGVLKRIGGARPSLVFRDSISLEEIQALVPESVSFDGDSGQVQGERRELLGRVIRSGPYSDDLVGYQGPTEMLLQLSPDGRVESIGLRQSFDKEPYVDYVRSEKCFWAIFEGKTLTELADFVPQDAGVEGVSGATMTSLAVAETLVAAARKVVAEDAAAEAPPSTWFDSLSFESVRWTRADAATIIALLMAGLFSRLGWFHVRLARRFWLLAVVVVIGLWSGNLVSMALIAGWSAEGVAWQLAPGLATITVATLLVPPLTKGNPYCNHLCPHGAVQQLVRPGSRSRRRLRLSPAAMAWLKRIPGLTLVVAYLTLITIPTIDLSSWEPFHAYLFRIASWGSIALAAATIALAAVIPMGYCRLGCPTGRLIDYVRRSAASDRIQTSDIVAVGLLVAAVALQRS